jgi:hypothetical protein
MFFFIFLVLSNSFIATYIKKAATESYKYAVFFSLTGIGIYLLDKYEIISFSEVSSAIFSLPLENPVYVFLPIIALAAVYNLNFGFLKSKLYMDNLQPAVSRKTGRSTLLQKIEGMGETGQYIALELKLLMRNKRSRTTVYFSISMILLGVMFYPVYLKDSSFPKPLPEHENFIARYENETAGQPDVKKVTFKVLPESVPENATLFIAGNHAVLRNWKADGLPLSVNSDSTWSRSVHFNEGIELQYKLTLGTWGHQRTLADGTIPANYNLVVLNDTTILLEADAWDTPPFKVFNSIFLIYIAILVVGMFLIAYGQFILGWESSHFDSILSNPVNYLKYFYAKFYIMLIVCTLFFIVSISYTFFGLTVLYINIAVFFYNIGVNSYVLLFMACLSRKRLDLDASIISTQGKGAGAYLTMVPTLLLPTIIYVPFVIAENQLLGMGFLAGLGIAGLIFHKSVMKLIITWFYRNKYKLATAFRIH